MSAEFGSNRDAISFIFSALFTSPELFLSCERERVRVHQEDVFDEEM